MAIPQNRSTLLHYAVSRLTPDIFSHPVWLRFGKENLPLDRQIADDLFVAAKNLQSSEPGIACQILLLCAVCQNNAAAHIEAIQTTQQAKDLAQAANLEKEMLWAMWGEAAIYIYQGHHEQACASLEDIQAVLSGQDEWILASFIDILRQDYCQPIADRIKKESQQFHHQQSQELLSFTWEWLHQWGCSVEALGRELESFADPSTDSQMIHSASIRSFFSIQKWQGRWQSFKLAVQGELKLQWTTKHVPPAKVQDSLWNRNENTILSTQELILPVQNLNAQPKLASLPAPIDIVLPLEESLKETSPKKATVSRNRPVSKPGKVERKRHLKPEITSIPVAVHMLGNFAMSIGDKAVKVPASKGLSVLKYLLLHHEQSMTREVLMDTFWPDAGVETARNSLNVAMHSLRKSLSGTSPHAVIKFEDGAYRLESNLQVWLDVDEFQKCVRAGQQYEARDQLTPAVAEYEAAVSLYQGDLLEQNPYEEWTVLERERLRIAYLDTLDRLSQIYFSQERYTACRTVCQLILVRDRCREDAHSLLMRCYSRQGQYPLALRQYQVCVEALRSELDVEPGPSTVQLADHIRKHEQI